MHLKKFFLMTMILSMLLLNACGEEDDDLDIALSPQNVSVMELTSMKYSKNQMEEMIGFEATINELDAIYPIECVRKIENGYRVAYCGEADIAILEFDDSGKKIFSGIYNISQPKSVFDVLTVGDTLKYVETIDPKGDYYFLYMGRNDVPAISTHYTNDGYMIKITYDDKYEYIISDIEMELI